MTLLMREREKYNEGREQGIAEGIAKGEIQGTIKTCKNLNLSFPETVQYLINNCNLSSLEAEENVKKYW